MFLTSLLLFSNLSFAATPSLDCTNLSAIQRSTNLSDETKSSIRSSCDELGKLQQKQKDQEKAMSKLETDKQYCGNVFSRLWQSVAGQSEAERKACSDEVAKAQAELEKTKKETAALQAAIKTRQEDFSKTVAAAGREATASQALKDSVAADIALVKAEYGNASLAVAELKLGTVEGRARLAKIESALDLSVMGQYMKDRMQNLLNSDVLCKATKACSAGTARDIHETELNSIFKVDQTPATSTVAKPATTPAASPAAAPATRRTRQ